MIHPTAQVHPSAQLAADVEIGAFAIVEADTVLGPGCRLAAHAVVRSGGALGSAVLVDSFAVVGGLPQMRSPVANPGRVVVGDRCVLREGVTIHRPTKAEGVTRLGNDCYLMANSHVAHDSNVGDFVTLANNAMLAGHVTVGAHSFVGGGAGIHQFVRVGPIAMIAGNAAISYDVPPFAIAADRNDVCGLNLVGLRRQGMDAATVADLKRCFRAAYFQGGDPRRLAAAALAAGTCGLTDAGRQFLGFFAEGKRGFARARRSKDGAESQAGE
jgi:UDP-N-acetylglucosamine acyltransferase